LIDWQTYFNEAIDEFRNQFEKLDSKAKEKAIKKFKNDLLFEPCQVEVLELEENGIIAFLISHNANEEDKKVIVKTKVNSESLSERYKSKNYSYSEPELSPIKLMLTLAPALNEPFIIFTKNGIFTWYEMTPKQFAEYLFKEINKDFREEKFKAIIKSTSDLEKLIAQIPQKETRAKLLSNTKSIDQAMSEIRRLDNDMDKVRKMVGMTKEIQDWRVFATDLERIKSEHLPKEIFDAKLTELNTKIEALSDMREAYNSVLAQQSEFMKQQAAVMQQQSSFITWIKYATVLVPLAVLLSPIINAIIIHFL
jgi:hypothetical protein